MLRKASLVLLAVMLVLSLSHSAMAALAAVGPVNPQNGFPLWYQDTNGLALELCLDPINCLADPPIPGNAFSQQVGFGAEAFYWGADALIGIPSGNALLVLALEAAWANEVPVDGDQVVFSRVRIRIDAPVNGTYVVTHPFGTEVFTNVIAGPDAINFTSDIGIGAPGVFTGALAGDIGPFLTAVAPAPPAGFVGNIAIDQTVTGSPTGNNFFRVQGPAGSNLDGLGGTQVQTNLFAVQGKVFTGIVPGNLQITRSSYTRVGNIGGQIDVFATADTGAAVTLDLGPTLTPTPVAMTNNAGVCFIHFTFAGAVTLPAQVSVTATPVGGTPTTLTSPLTDEVTITSAAYESTGQRRFLVEATSSDSAAPPATLTAAGIGALVNGRLLLTGITTPPASVTVTSSKGGSATKMVTVNRR